MVELRRSLFPTTSTPRMESGPMMVPTSHLPEEAFTLAMGHMGSAFLELGANKETAVPGGEVRWSPR